MTQPLLRIVSDGGGAWGLSDAAYIRWWHENLTEDDRRTFAELGADESLGRFVCAYDFLCADSGEQPGTLTRAWAVATGKDETDPQVRLTALRAWEHPAVRELLDRLLGRESSRAARRIERNTAALVEDTLVKALESESLDNRAKAITAAARYLNQVSADRQGNRDSRARLELEKLKSAITIAQTKPEQKTELTDEEAIEYAKLLVGRLGPDRIKALLPAPPIDA